MENVEVGIKENSRFLKGIRIAAFITIIYHFLYIGDVFTYMGMPLEPFLHTPMHIGVILAFLFPIPLIFGAWAVAGGWVAMLALYSLFAGCLGMTGNASMALMSDSFPPELRGAAFSVRMTGFRMGSIVGPLLGGYLYSSLSPRARFVAAAVLFLVGIPIIYLIKERSRETA